VLALGSRELFLVSVVAIGVGVGYATQSAGLSFASGAFVAGLVLGGSEFSHQALSDVVPIRDIFGLLFFVSVGMLLDPRYARSHALEIAGVVFLTLFGKAIIIGGLTRAFGYFRMAPWIVGLGLSQIGEFSFVLARSGLSSGMLSQTTYDLALTCTVVTMALAPLVSTLAHPAGRAWQTLFPERRSSEPVPPATEAVQDHVIVAGYGRSGRAVARALKRAGVPFIAVELNHGVFREVAVDGFTGVWGDITSEQVLRAAQIKSARIVLLALPERDTARLAVTRARQMNPTIIVVARAARPSHVAELRSLGVNTVIQPEFEGGVEMARQALVQYPCDSSVTSRVLADLRDEFYGLPS
jgi:monovalent cation:H+ antiporter-2, CPA2 family